MADFVSNTPVAFIIFNRPDTTEQVFSQIAKAKPPKLLVIADGSRPNIHGEMQKCAAARAIIDRVDWECDVLKNYSESNMGCRRRVSSGLDWVFDTVDEAIVLEDDCVPHLTFFRFCEELLEKYRHDERIMAISGDNFQVDKTRNGNGYSYYFSRYNHVWGWASWRRAWSHYDVDMKAWPIIRDEGQLNDILAEKTQAKYWHNIFQDTFSGQVNTWDYQWTFACWLQSGLTILPKVNLVSNIGFRSDGTHTKVVNLFSNLPSQSMDFPLSHPPHIIRDSKADAFTAKSMFFSRLYNRVKRAMGICKIRV